MLHYEGELAIIIGRCGRDIHPEGAPHFILGYSCFNDVTARDIQKSDVQWTRGKGFDTFAPLGPCIETEVDPDNLSLKTLVNGQVRQSSNTSNMTFSPYFLVSYISRIMTLMPGDVIATGTPAGVGELRAGDKVEVKIESIGALMNRITEENNES
jgi:2-keto-4-pentenoate hydratase/2-oxohepta-3-ene-1,7-dioic acid hydratase in catechol pathway